MNDKRLVHDILCETDGAGKQRRHVSLIQHGNVEDGFTYEAICVWCAETLGYVPKAQTKVIGGLYRILLHLQKIHWQTCSKNTVSTLREMMVEVATKPLNTEKKFEIQ